MITVTTSVHFTTTRAGRKRLHATAAAAQVAPMGRVPRVSKLMALAIRFDRLVRDGVVSDLAELARLASVTQPRMTQIMNLNHLAPDIQEELLFLPRTLAGRDAMHERMLRGLRRAGLGIAEGTLAVDKCFETGITDSAIDRATCQIARRMTQCGGAGRGVSMCLPARSKD